MYLSVRLGTHMCAPAVLPSHLVVTSHPCNFLPFAPSAILIEDPEGNNMRSVDI